MKVIAAALRNNVNHATCGATVLSLEARRLDLNILNELERDVVVSVQRARPEVGYFLAVDDEGVLRSRCSVYLETAAKRLIANSRSDR